MEVQTQRFILSRSHISLYLELYINRCEGGGESAAAYIKADLHGQVCSLTAQISS